MLTGGPDGRPQWLTEAAEILEAGTEQTFQGVTTGTPHFLAMARTDRLETSAHQPFGDPSVPGPYMVFVNASTPSYVEHIVRPVVAMLPEDYGTRGYEREELAAALGRRLEDDPDSTAFAFAEAATYMASDGHDERLQRRLPSPERVPVALQLQSSAVMFILAHEIAHYELGHLGNDWAQARMHLQAPLPDTYRGREFQADLAGMMQVSHARHVHNGVSAEFGTTGPALFMLSHLALEYAWCVLDSGSADAGKAMWERLQQRQDPDSHPSPQQRFEFLYSGFVEYAGPSAVLTALWMPLDMAVTRLLPYLGRYAEDGAINHGLRPAERFSYLRRFASEN